MATDRTAISRVKIRPVQIASTLESREASQRKYDVPKKVSEKGVRFFYCSDRLNTHQIKKPDTFFGNSSIHLPTPTPTCIQIENDAPLSLVPVGVRDHFFLVPKTRPQADIDTVYIRKRSLPTPHFSLVYN